MYLEKELKRLCTDLGKHCDEVVIVAKPQGQKPKVVTYGSLPECSRLAEYAKKSIEHSIG